MAAELLKQFEPEIETLTLIPSDGGRFEIVVNQELIYSKLATHRHVEPGEVVRMINQLIRKGKP